MAIFRRSCEPRGLLYMSSGCLLRLIVLAFVYDYKVKGLCMELFLGVSTHTYFHSGSPNLAQRLRAAGQELINAFHLVYRSAIKCNLSHHKM